jgi:hypothetical protein
MYALYGTKRSALTETYRWLRAPTWFVSRRMGTRMSFRCALSRFIGVMCAVDVHPEVAPCLRGARMLQ